MELSNNVQSMGLTVSLVSFAPLLQNKKYYGINIFLNMFLFDVDTRVYKCIQFRYKQSVYSHSKRRIK